MRSRARKPTRSEKETYLRDALGLKRIVRDGRASWVKDRDTKELKLQFGQGVTNKL